MADKWASKAIFHWRWKDHFGVKEVLNPGIWWDTSWIEDGEWNTFMWDQDGGNCGCDCNRAQYFMGLEDQPCGHEFEILDIEIFD